MDLNDDDRVLYATPLLGSKMCPSHARTDVMFKDNCRSRFQTDDDLIDDARTRARKFQCRLLQVERNILMDSDTFINVHLVMERVKTDLLSEVKERKDQNRMYTESELRKFMIEIASELAYAKAQVTDT